jgi:hypothetical protein
MFGFFKKSGPHPASAGLSQALVTAGRVSSTDVAELRVLDRRGTYSARPVTHFRVFNAVNLANRAVTVATYTDLDPYPELVLATGHLEQDGTVVLNRAHNPSSPAPGRL